MAGHGRGEKTAMSAPELRNEDEAAQYYLSTLREGSRAEKIVARAGLAAIFSRRGLYEEAAELYELNIRAGVRTPELFQQLSGVYRELGDNESARAALAEARRLASEAALTPAPPRTAASAPPSPADPGPSRPAVPVAEPDEPPPTLRMPRTPAPAVVDQAAEVNGTGRPADATTRMPISSHADETRQVPLTDPAAVPPAPAAGLSETRQRGGRLAALPTPVMIPAVVLGLIVLPVVLLAVLVVNPIALYLEGRAAGPTVEAGPGAVGAGGPAVVKIAPGASSAWYIQAGRSVSGLWATSGLELTLDHDIDGAGHQFVVSGSRPQSWGETITIVERRGQGRSNQALVIPASFDAPGSLPPTGTELDGHVSGQVTAPRLSETSQFNTTTETVDVPIRLVVVSTPSLWLDRFVNAVRMYFDEERWLLVTIGALLTWCILAGATAIIFRVGQR
jgi:hypothetical protein